jgi:AcrR family transcriptional regulator
MAKEPALERPRPAALRREKARATRRRMVEAAHRLITERGYSATTMADIAVEAGVAVQTVYFTYHTKLALVREAFDFAVVGSHDLIPPDQQPWFAAVRDEPDLTRALKALVEHVTLISRRVAPLAEALRSLGKEPEAEAFYRDRERLRHEGFGRILDVLTAKRPLRASLDPSTALDAFFALLSPELYQALVIGREWPEERWTEWITQTLEETLFGRP